ncbi:MAG: BlaI/MecI/CopY family transcriptional regulator [Pseudomonadales bacterium]|jgi:predicted transcriptional regulator|nr:BlaI/MecI/CopY family transcriptional regulator [Pseudomonadales bacterium]
MPVSQNLSRRERQIMEIIYELGEASAKDVQARLPNAPGYSAIRATMNKLEDKAFLSHREQDLKYIYFPTIEHDQARSTALQRLLKTFFSGSAKQAMSTLLDLSLDEVSDKELKEMQAMINKARKQRQDK